MRGEKNLAYGADLLAYGGIPTFMRQAATRDLETLDVAVVGIPYDGGATSYRSGARLAPRAIRNASPLLWGFHREHAIAPLGVLRVGDYGDVRVSPGDAEATLESVYQEASTILRAGVHILALGGDHSITLPLLRAHAEHYGPLALLHLDAHADTWPGPWDHSSVFRLAREEGLIDPTAWIQVGIRGPLWSEADITTPTRLGAQVWTTGDCHTRGMAAVIAAARQAIGTKPLYLSLDLDAFDPAFAPAVGTPEVGGLTSYQGLQLLRGLKGVHIVGADIVELCPPYDAAEITAILAANLAFEVLALMALAHQPSLGTP